MAVLKMFRGNWDGRRERAVVCATKKEAMALLGTSLSTMNGYFSQPDSIARPAFTVVWSSPGVVFQRRMRSTTEQDPWVPVKSSD